VLVNLLTTYPRGSRPYLARARSVGDFRRFVRRLCALTWECRTCSVWAAIPCSILRAYGLVYRRMNPFGMSIICPLRLRSPLATGTYCWLILNISVPTLWITTSIAGATRLIIFSSVGRTFPTVLI